MEDFIGRKTKEQIKMIKAIVALDAKGKETFSAQDISKLCGIDTKNFAGAFVALAKSYGDIQALILRFRREKVDMIDKSRRYVQMWRINPKFKKKYWDSLIEVLNGYSIK